MRDQLHKAFELAKKAGGRLIVFDGQFSQSAYAILSIDEYEKLLDARQAHGIDPAGLTESALIDKINSDIALWHSAQIGESQDEAHFASKATPERRPQTNNQAKIAELSKPFPEQRLGRRGTWAIPPQRKSAATEIEETDELSEGEISF